MIGYTKDELGGSEYFYQIFDSYSGKCPQVKFQTSKQHMNIVLTLLKNKLIKSITDCSKGGLAFAIAKLCMMNQIGCIVNLNLIPHSKLNNDKLLFSESHSRFILAVSNHNLDQTISILNSQCILFNIIGKFNSNNLIFKQNNLHVINLNIKTLHNKWMTSINKMMSNGK